MARGVARGDAERAPRDVEADGARVVALAEERDGDAADPVPTSQTRGSGVEAKSPSAVSTSSSVSGRGMRTSGLTSKSRP